MKSALLVIAPEVFRDEEYAEPKAVLEGRGFTVTTASTHVGECIGKLGMRATAQLTVHDALTSDWDAVAFIGGAGAARYFDDADAHDLARKTLESGAILGAICIAPSVLAHAGLLDGVEATAFPSQHGDLVAHGAHWTGAAVTVSDRIITANGPESAQRFGEALADAITANARQEAGQ